MESNMERDEEDAQGIHGEMKPWRILGYWVWKIGHRWWETERPGMIWWSLNP